MIFAFNFIEFASVEGFVFGIPETAGLLIFGLAMTIFAIVIRRSMKKDDADENTHKIEKKA